MKSEIINRITQFVVQSTITSPFKTVAIRIMSTPVAGGEAQNRWLACFKQVRSSEGLLAFWRGNLVECIGGVFSILIVNHIKTNLVENARRQQQQRRQRPSQQQAATASTVEADEFFKLLAGLTGMMVATALVYPFESMRAHAALDANWTLRGELRLPHGFLSLYSGLSARLLSVLLERLSMFFLMQALIPVCATSLAIRSARLLSICLRQPLEVVVRRMQARPELYSSWHSSLQQIRLQEGFSALFCGLVFSICCRVGA